jgi:hypothetical protein
MNFGYLIIVSKHDDIDYDRLAYAQALSIKNTQKEGYDKVALVIDDKSRLSKLKSPWVFDHVIEWNQETFWDGRSWMNELSPWDETICLDADMLFLRDYSHWVDYFVENSTLYFPNRTYTYRGEIVDSDAYRKTFTANELPNIYSLYSFFKKDQPIVKDFFKLSRHITKNQTEFSNIFLKEFKPKVVGTDEAFALAAKILGIDDVVTYDLDFPKVVHLKPLVQNWPWPANYVFDHVGFYFDLSGNLKIGNYQQTDIVHCVEKDKIDDEVISILEKIAWKK